MDAKVDVLKALGIAEVIAVNSPYAEDEAHAESIRLARNAVASLILAARDAWRHEDGPSMRALKEALRVCGVSL